MLEPVSLPKNLRREIVTMVKLKPENIGKPDENTFIEQFDEVISGMVDLACYSLQGNPPTPEMDAQFIESNTQIFEIAKIPGLKTSQQDLLRSLQRHALEIRLLCQNPLLQEELKDEKFPLPSYSNLTETVILANGQLMAESIRLFLDSFGIQSILGRESAGVIYGLTVGPLGEVDVNVSPDNAIDARILLDAMQKGYFDLKNEEEVAELSDVDNPEIDVSEADRIR